MQNSRAESSAIGFARTLAPDCWPTKPLLKPYALIKLVISVSNSMAAAEAGSRKPLDMCSNKVNIAGIGEVCQHTVPKLADMTPSAASIDLPSPLIDREERWPPKPCFVAEHEQVLTTSVQNQHADSSKHAPSLLQRAGATERIHLDPSKVVACIVTCGGYVDYEDVATDFALMCTSKSADFAPA